MTYEEQREQERKEHMERFNRTVATIKDVKLDGWTYQTWEGEQSGTPRELGKLVNADLKGAIWFSFSWNDKTRLVIHVEWPHDRNGHTYGPRYGETSPSITVNVNKTAEQITNDIKRRLLPDYLPMLETRLADIVRHESSLDALTSNGRALATAFPTLRLLDSTNDSSGGSVSLNTPYDAEHARVEIKVSEKKVDVSIDNLTVEQAIAILKPILGR